MTMSEETVECFYYSEKQEDWECLCSDINKVIAQNTKDYIWHKDELKLILPVKDSIPHLYSSTVFGDNIEDEWFIVYLNLEISKLYEHLVIQMKDDDGDFLLIESALHLPKWCKPENMDNRVYIHKGKLHIIAPSKWPLDKELAVNDAIHLILSISEDSLASPEIQTAIQARVKNYPDKIHETKHRAIVRLPVELAAILKINPSIISWLVHAYCQHDVIDAKCFKNDDFKEFVNVQVCFTKCLYAMLLHSKDLQTKRFKSHDKSHVLGDKLTAGYKILLSEPNSDISKTKDYKRFIKNLTDNGYFQGNIEHSKEYCKLLEKANVFFASAESPRNVALKKVISEIESSPVFLNTIELIKQSKEPLFEDSDDWLNINPEDLNNILNTKYTKTNLTPQDITNEFSKFLCQPSDLEGIEMNEENASEETLELDVNLFAETLQKMLNFVAPNGENIEPDDDTASDSEDEECDLGEDYNYDNLDKELQKSLCSDVIIKNSNDLKKNLTKNLQMSVKEENGLSGPSSNILRQIGINKKDMLDSDDDLD